MTSHQLLCHPLVSLSDPERPRAIPRIPSDPERSRAVPSRPEREAARRGLSAREDVTPIFFR